MAALATQLFHFGVPFWQLIVRSAVIYLVLLAALRLFGKREVGQFTLYDLVLILLVANAVQPAMTGPDASLGGGMIIIGFAGGDRGTRSRVKAYDAKDGRLIWTFYTIPGPGEPGFETWPKDNDAWKYGGGSIWQTPEAKGLGGPSSTSTSGAARRAASTSPA